MTRDERDTKIMAWISNGQHPCDTDALAKAIESFDLASASADDLRSTIVSLLMLWTSTSPIFNAAADVVNATDPKLPVAAVVHLKEAVERSINHTDREAEQAGTDERLCRAAGIALTEPS